MITMTMTLFDDMILTHLLTQPTSLTQVPLTAFYYKHIN